MHVQYTGDARLLKEESIRKESQVVNVRFQPGLVKTIDKWVIEGNFKSRSDLISIAVRHYLELLEHNKIEKMEVYARYEDSQR
jgi:metal-responsive CopG/Arc/MetJ family transcriptional regulator